MFQGVGVDDQAWDDPLPPSVIVVAVVVAQPVDLLRESAFAGLGVAPRAAFAGHCTCVWAVGVLSELCALGQIRACCCQGKFQSSPCARWVPFSAQRKRPESPYLVECAFLVLSRHRCRGEGGVLKKRSDWVGSVLRISLRVPSLSARRVPLPRGIPWVARVASPGFSSQA